MNLPGIDLASCDREPIHIPGSIQPHGLLLVVEQSSGKIIHAAGDAEKHLGVTNLLDAHMEDVFGANVAAAILSPDGSMPRNIIPPHAKKALDIRIVRGANEYLIELLPAASEEVVTSLLPKLEAAARNFDKASNISELLDTAAQEFRRLTGDDRVMVYRFLEDDAGKVVAEAVAEGLVSFKNHHFPASDIPAQARALYVRNLVRVIPDIDYEPAPLLPARDAQNPLDMSDCSLRSVSPIHLQYLRNMGVKASASFSIIKDEILWGMIACHNFKPRVLPFDVQNGARALCAALGRQIKSREESEVYRERMRLRSFEDRTVDFLSRKGGLSTALSGQLAEVQNMFSADGVVVIRDDEIISSGKCPEHAVINKLIEWNLSKEPRTVFATHQLSATDAPAEAICPLSAGVMAMTLSASDPWMVLWFRAEVIETVKWAGNPHNAKIESPAGILTPRASFNSWSETVRGKARRWKLSEIEAAERLANAIQNVWQTNRIRELNKELVNLVKEKEALLKQREFLLGEVNHRVQNSLTLVSSFLSMQARESRDEATREAIEEARRRIFAVSLVHRRLYGSDQVRTVDGSRYIDELLDDLLASIDDGWKKHLKRDLHPVLLPNDRAISIGLILTELFINANKYAYSGNAGPIHVTLTESGNIFRLTVTDEGQGRQSSSRGFGSRMIDVLVQQLQGTLQFSDNNPGTCAALSAPIEAVFTK